jgi:hypothetical protein
LHFEGRQYQAARRLHTCCRRCRGGPPLHSHMPLVRPMAFCGAPRKSIQCCRRCGTKRVWSGSLRSSRAEQALNSWVPECPVSIFSPLTRGERGLLQRPDHGRRKAECPRNEPSITADARRTACQLQPARLVTKTRRDGWGSLPNGDGSHREQQAALLSTRSSRSRKNEKAGASSD